MNELFPVGRPWLIRTGDSRNSSPCWFKISRFHWQTFVAEILVPESFGFPPQHVPMTSSCKACSLRPDSCSAAAADKNVNRAHNAHAIPAHELFPSTISSSAAGLSLKEHFHALTCAQLAPVDNNGRNCPGAQRTRRQHHCETMSNESG